MNVVDLFYQNLDSWNRELTQLREIIKSCGLQEEFKWKQPCYTDRNKNILILSPFKNYCAVNFFKGSLLKDELGKLTKPGENSDFARQWRFTDLEEINQNSDLIKAYVFEAIENEQNGEKVKVKKVEDLDFPDELQLAFEDDKVLESSFYSLTPGR